MKGRTGKTKKYASGGKVSNFGAAFRDAKKGGAKEFTFGGKKYNTRTADEDYADKLKASNKAMKAVGPAPKTVSGPPASTSVSKAASPPKAKEKAKEPLMKMASSEERAATYKKDQADSDAKAKARSAKIADAVSSLTPKFKTAPPSAGTAQAAADEIKNKAMVYRRGGKVRKKKYI